MAEKKSKEAESKKSSSNTQKLKHPITFDEKVITTVTYRRAVGDDILAADLDMQDHGILMPGDATRMMYVVAQATGQPIEVLKKMDMVDDYLPLLAKVGGSFL